MANRKVQDLIGQMQKNIECSICLEMLTNPVSTNCGHQFCRYCLIEFLERKRQVPCPLCKKSITKRSLAKRNQLEGMVKVVRKLMDAFQTDTGCLFSPPRGAAMNILPCTPDYIKDKTRSSVRVRKNLRCTTRKLESVADGPDLAMEQRPLSIPHHAPATKDTIIPTSNSKKSKTASRQHDAKTNTEELIKVIKEGEHCVRQHEQCNAKDVSQGHHVDTLLDKDDKSDDQQTRNNVGGGMPLKRALLYKKSASVIKNGPHGCFDSDCETNLNKMEPLATAGVCHSADATKSCISISSLSCEKIEFDKSKEYIKKHIVGVIQETKDSTRENSNQSDNIDIPETMPSFNIDIPEIMPSVDKDIPETMQSDIIDVPEITPSDDIDISEIMPSVDIDIPEIMQSDDRDIPEIMLSVNIDKQETMKPDNADIPEIMQADSVKMSFTPDDAKMTFSHEHKKESIFTYSRKDMNQHSKKRFANHKVAQWLNRNPQDKIKREKMEVTMDRNTNLVCNKKLTQTNLKIKQDEEMMGQKMKNLAKQIHKGNGGLLFDCEDFENLEEEMLSNNTKKECVMITEGEHQTDNGDCSNRTKKECVAITDDELQTREGDNERNQVGVDIEKFDLEYGAVGGQSAGSNMVKAHHVKGGLELINNAEIKKGENKNAKCIPIKRKRIFKTRKSNIDQINTDNCSIEDKPVPNKIRALSNISNQSVQIDKNENLPIDTELANSDPYEFKSSGLTPQKTAKEKPKRRHKHNAKTREGKNQNLKKKSGNKILKEKEKDTIVQTELDKLSKDINQAQDYDLLTCTQEAVESICAEHKCDKILNGGTITGTSDIGQDGKKVRFREPVISDFISPGKINLIAYRNAKMHTSCHIDDVENTVAEVKDAGSLANTEQPTHQEKSIETVEILPEKVLKSELQFEDVNEKTNRSRIEGKAPSTPTVDVLEQSPQVVEETPALLTVPELNMKYTNMYNKGSADDDLTQNKLAITPEKSVEAIKEKCVVGVVPDTPVLNCKSTDENSSTQETLDHRYVPSEEEIADTLDENPVPDKYKNVSLNTIGYIAESVPGESLKELTDISQTESVEMETIVMSETPITDKIVEQMDTKSQLETAAEEPESLTQNSESILVLKTEPVSRGKLSNDISSKLINDKSDKKQSTQLDSGSRHSRKRKRECFLLEDNLSESMKVEAFPAEAELTNNCKKLKPVQLRRNSSRHSAVEQLKTEIIGLENVKSEGTHVTLGTGNDANNTCEFAPKDHEDMHDCKSFSLSNEDGQISVIPDSVPSTLSTFDSEMDDQKNSGYDKSCVQTSVNSNIVPEISHQNSRKVIHQEEIQVFEKKNNGMLYGDDNSSFAENTDVPDSVLDESAIDKKNTRPAPGNMETCLESSSDGDRDSTYIDEGKLSIKTNFSSSKYKYPKTKLIPARLFDTQLSPNRKLPISKYESSIPSPTTCGQTPEKLSISRNKSDFVVNSIKYSPALCKKYKNNSEENSSIYTKNAKPEVVDLYTNDVSEHSDELPELVSEHVLDENKDIESTCRIDGENWNCDSFLFSAKNEEVSTKEKKPSKVSPKLILKSPNKGNYLIYRPDSMTDGNENENIIDGKQESSLENICLKASFKNLNKEKNMPTKINDYEKTLNSSSSSEIRLCSSSDEEEYTNAKKQALSVISRFNQIVEESKQLFENAKQMNDDNHCIEKDIITCTDISKQFEESRYSTYIDSSPASMEDSSQHVTLESNIENIDMDHDDESDSVESRESLVRRKCVKKSVISDCSSEDEDDNCARQMNLTYSSAISSQSEFLTSQERLAMEMDLEKMAHEMKTLKQQMCKYDNSSGNRKKHKTEIDTDSLQGVIVVDDSDDGIIEVLDSGDEDEDTLFMSQPPLSPRQLDPTPMSPHQQDQTPMSPHQLDPTPLSPRQLDPTPLSPHQLDPTPLSPHQLDPIPLSPHQMDPTPLSPHQLDPTPLSPHQLDQTRLESQEPLHTQEKSGNLQHDGKVNIKNHAENVILQDTEPMPRARTALPDISDNVQPEHFVHCKKEKGFIATGLSVSQILSTKRLAALHDVKFYMKFNDAITHVIVKPNEEDDLLCDRTLKLFQGIAQKCWVVNYFWITDSQELGYFLPEGPYEIQGDTVNGDKHEGPRRSRLSKNRLFGDITFSLFGDNDFLSIASMTSLLQMCGGQVVDLDCLGRCHKKSLIIMCTDIEEEGIENRKKIISSSRELVSKKKTLMVTREWVLDSLTRYKLQPPRDYTISGVKK